MNRSTTNEILRQRDVYKYTYSLNTNIIHNAVDITAAGMVATRLGKHLIAYRSVNRYRIVGSDGSAPEGAADDEGLEMGDMGGDGINADNNDMDPVEIDMRERGSTGLRFRGNRSDSEGDSLLRRSESELQDRMLQATEEGASGSARSTVEQLTDELTSFARNIEISPAWVATLAVVAVAAVIVIIDWAVQSAERRKVANELNEKEAQYQATFNEKCRRLGIEPWTAHLNDTVNSVIGKQTRRKVQMNSYYGPGLLSYLEWRYENRDTLSNSKVSVYEGLERMFQLYHTYLYVGEFVYDSTGAVDNTLYDQPNLKRLQRLYSTKGHPYGYLEYYNLDLQTLSGDFDTLHRFLHAEHDNLYRAGVHDLTVKHFKFNADTQLSASIYAMIALVASVKNESPTDTTSFGVDELMVSIHTEHFISNNMPKNIETDAFFGQSDFDLIRARNIDYRRYIQNQLRYAPLRRNIDESGAYVDSYRKFTGDGIGETTLKSFLDGTYKALKVEIHSKEGDPEFLCSIYFRATEEDVLWCISNTSQGMCFLYSIPKNTDRLFFKTFSPIYVIYPVTKRELGTHIIQPRSDRTVKSLLSRMGSNVESSSFDTPMIVSIEYMSMKTVIKVFEDNRYENDAIDSELDAMMFGSDLTLKPKIGTDQRLFVLNGMAQTVLFRPYYGLDRLYLYDMMHDPIAKVHPVQLRSTDSLTIGRAKPISIVFPLYADTNYMLTSRVEPTPDGGSGTNDVLQGDAVRLWKATPEATWQQRLSKLFFTPPSLELVQHPLVRYILGSDKPAYRGYRLLHPTFEHALTFFLDTVSENGATIDELRYARGYTSACTTVMHKDLATLTALTNTNQLHSDRQPIGPAKVFLSNSDLTRVKHETMEVEPGIRLGTPVGRTMHATKTKLVDGQTMNSLYNDFQAGMQDLFALSNDRAWVYVLYAEEGTTFGISAICFNQKTRAVLIATPTADNIDVSTANVQPPPPSKNRSLLSNTTNNGTSISSSLFDVDDGIKFPAILVCVAASLAFAGVMTTGMPVVSAAIGITGSHALASTTIAYVVHRYHKKWKSQIEERFYNSDTMQVDLSVLFKQEYLGYNKTLPSVSRVYDGISNTASNTAVISSDYLSFFVGSGYDAAQNVVVQAGAYSLYNYIQAGMVPFSIGIVPSYRANVQRLMMYLVSAEVQSRSVGVTICMIVHNYPLAVTAGVVVAVGTTVGVIYYVVHEVAGITTIDELKESGVKAVKLALATATAYVAVKQFSNGLGYGLGVGLVGLSATAASKTSKQKRKKKSNKSNPKKKKK